MEQFSQQVNFYRDEFKKQVVFLSAMQILMLAGAFLLVFAILTVVQATMLKQLEDGASVAINQKEKMSEQLAKLEANYVEPRKDPVLINKLSKIDEDISKKKTLVEYLGGQSDKKVFSFSSVMNSLAEQSIKGIWLTELTIKTDGSHYRLVGNTQHPDLIPRYIDQLKNSDVLAGTSFNLFDLERAKKEKNYLKFILSSEEVANESKVTSR